MKKIIAIITMFLIIILGTVASYAVGEEKSIEFNLTPSVMLEQGERTATLIISLGDFVGIEDGIVLGYEGVISYDANIIESVSVEGMNGWIADCSETTMNMQADTSSAKANTQITKITCTLKEGLEPGTTTTFQINNILLTDDTNDFEYTKSAQITVGEKQSEETEETNAIVNEQTPEITVNKQNDETVANAPIPQTGEKSILFIATAIVMIGIFSYIRVRTIKLK